MNGRRRLWIELALGVGAGALGLLTLFWRGWIESVFGVDPDHGSGSLEWIVVLGLLALALICGLAARSELRRVALARHVEP